MPTKLPSEVTIKITLQESEPAIWRHVAVTDDISLDRLHDVIQAAMGWFDCHLHEFHISDRIYGVPSPDFEDMGHPVLKESGLKLKTLVQRGIKRFEYIYDFGDYWVHDIKIERMASPSISTWMLTSRRPFSSSVYTVAAGGMAMS